MTEICWTKNKSTWGRYAISKLFVTQAKFVTWRLARNTWNAGLKVLR